MKKLNEINMDITLVKSGVIIHQVNCQNAMGAGVAKALYLKYPIVKKHYHNIFNSYKKETLFGGLQKISISDDLFILNSFSQFNYGSNKDIIYTDYDKLFNNIKKALEFANFKNLKLYIPKYIGCGLANGDWSKVENFIFSLNSDNIIICYL